MKVDFILVASGSLTLPIINNAIFSDGSEDAKMKAEKAVAALYDAGYRLFTLFDTRRLNKDEMDIKIATFRVAEREHHVIMN